jgi:hypothetical protein
VNESTVEEFFWIVIVPLPTDGRSADVMNPLSFWISLVFVGTEMLIDVCPDWFVVNEPTVELLRLIVIVPLPTVGKADDVIHPRSFWISEPFVGTAMSATLSVAEFAENVATVLPFF